MLFNDCFYGLNLSLFYVLGYFCIVIMYHTPRWTKGADIFSFFSSIFFYSVYFPTKNVFFNEINSNFQINFPFLCWASFYSSLFPFLNRLLSPLFFIRIGKCSIVPNFQKNEKSLCFVFNFHCFIQRIDLVEERFEWVNWKMHGQ